MTTTLVQTEHVLTEDRGTGGNYLLYGPTASRITEETEYIKQIRSTLAKVQPLFWESESSQNIANGGLESQSPVQELEVESHPEALDSNYKMTMERIKEMDQELSQVNKENEWLKIKLEASRVAGAEAVRNGVNKLQDDYMKRSEDLKKRHQGTIHIMTAQKLAQEQKLKESTDTLNRLNVQLQEKYSQIDELEKRVQRMEEEKKTLTEKKKLLKKKLQLMMSNAENSRSCVAVQTQISTLQEQISHLEHVIRSQHKELHGVIHQLEELNGKLKDQDEQIESLKEKAGVLQAKNKELHYKVEFWSGQSKAKASKGVSARLDGASLYTMVTRLRK